MPLLNNRYLKILSSSVILTQRNKNPYEQLCQAATRWMRENFKCIKDKKMSHLNTKKSFPVSDILEKLPKNSSKVSIHFQISGIWKVFWHFPWINNSFIKQLSSSYPELRFFFDPLRKVAYVLASFCFLLKYNWPVPLEFFVLFNPGEAKRKRIWRLSAAWGQPLWFLPTQVLLFGHAAVFATTWAAARQAPCPWPSPRACTQVRLA